MTDTAILEILKEDLLFSSPDLDGFLEGLLSSAKARIAEEGIVLDYSSSADCILAEQYAAWLYRSRKEKEPKMPRSLRWALNCKLFGGA